MSCIASQSISPTAGRVSHPIPWDLHQPGIADFEMDTMWIVWAGQDPVGLLKKYPGRWPLMHLKDPKKGVQGARRRMQSPATTCL